MGVRQWDGDRRSRLDGAAAQLIRLADLAQIVLPTRLADYCARRFAIVHELYHWLKRQPSLSPTMMCKPKWLRGGDGRPHVFEIGSNAFAGAVLLPRNPRSNRRQPLGSRQWF